MPGSIAANPHEGTRSEYLALYVFSALGTAVPVPHPEDSGIDLYCTLGKMIGRRLAVENYFLVQVKSQKVSVRYEGPEQARWVLTHHYPILICYIDKTAGIVEIYQTLSLSFLYAKTALNSITLSPTEVAKQFSDHTGETDPVIHMGKPILKFDISKIGTKHWRENARETVRSWVEIERENIGLKLVGSTLFRYPEAYKTNVPVVGAKSFIGNVFDTDKSAEHRAAFYDVLLRQLAQLISLAAADKDIHRFNSIATFAKSITDHQPIPDCWGANLFAFSYNTGCKHLNLSSPPLVLNKADGRSYTFVGTPVG